MGRWGSEECTLPQPQAANPVGGITLQDGQQLHLAREKPSPVWTTPRPKPVKPTQLLRLLLNSTHPNQPG